MRSASLGNNIRVNQEISEERMATAKKPDAGSGPPKWTYVVAAVVAVGGLLATIAKDHFSKPEPAKTSVVPTQGSASVTVSGSGAVGVGNMSGGTITLGAQPAKAEITAAPGSAAK